MPLCPLTTHSATLPLGHTMLHGHSTTLYHTAPRPHTMSTLPLGHTLSYAATRLDHTLLHGHSTTLCYTAPRPHTMLHGHGHSTTLCHTVCLCLISYFRSKKCDIQYTFYPLQSRILNSYRQVQSNRIPTYTNDRS